MDALDTEGCNGWIGCGRGHPAAQFPTLVTQGATDSATLTIFLFTFSLPCQTGAVGWPGACVGKASPSAHKSGGCPGTRGGQEGRAGIKNKNLEVPLRPSRSGVPEPPWLRPLPECPFCARETGCNGKSPQAKQTGASCASAGASQAPSVFCGLQLYVQGKDSRRRGCRAPHTAELVQYICGASTCGILYRPPVHRPPPPPRNTGHPLICTALLLQHAAPLTPEGLVPCIVLGAPPSPPLDPRRLWGMPPASMYCTARTPGGWNEGREGVLDGLGACASSTCSRVFGCRVGPRCTAPTPRRQAPMWGTKGPSPALWAGRPYFLRRRADQGIGVYTLSPTPNNKTHT